MAIDDMIRGKKLKCDINREAAEILTLSSGEIDKYKYIAREKVYIYIFCLTFEKQTENQVDLLKLLNFDIKTN